MNGFDEHIYNNLLERCGGDYGVLLNLLRTLYLQCERDISFILIQREEENE